MKQEDMDFREGDEIGPYRVVRALGRGGMGAVYEVEHVNLGVRYALKAFTLDHGHVDLLRKRFLAEGKVLARLRHPNIARVFDLDVLDDGAFAYFVMDLVLYKDGASYTLADLEVGGADEEHLVRWFGQLASALDYIHDVGIVHRDIKPGNILLNDHGGVTLSDFGISRFEGERIRREVDVSRTLVSSTEGAKAVPLVMGTAGFLAPEVLRGEPATAVADSYALGVTFFRLLTGLWYESGTDAPRLLEPFGEAWSEVLPPMLAKDPAKRPTRLAPLAQRLQAATGCMDDRETVLSENARTVTSASRRQSRDRRRTRRRLAVLAGGVLLLAAAGLALYAVLRPSEQSSANDFDRLFEIPSCIT